MNKRELTKKFKEAGLNKDQISYAHTLKSMYGSTPLDKIIKMAKEFEPLILVKVEGYSESVNLESTFAPGDEKPVMRPVGSCFKIPKNPNKAV